MTPDAAYCYRVGVALASLGGVEAIDRLSTMGEGEARAWLAARSPAEREVIALVLGFDMPEPNPNADLAALLKLDERVLYGRLKMATPEFRARFARYLKLRSTSPEELAQLFESFDEAPISAPDSV